MGFARCLELLDKFTGNTLVGIIQAAAGLRYNDALFWAKALHRCEHFLERGEWDSKSQASLCRAVAQVSLITSETQGHVLSEGIRRKLFASVAASFDKACATTVGLRSVADVACAFEATATLDVEFARTLSNRAAAILK